MRKNGSPIPRYSAASSMMRMSRYESSRDTSSRPAPASGASPPRPSLPPASNLDVGRAAGAIRVAAADSFSTSRALAWADNPNRPLPATILLLRRFRLEFDRIDRRIDQLGRVGHRGEPIVICPLVALGHAQ